MTVEIVITVLVICLVFNLLWDGVKYALTAYKLRRLRRAELIRTAKEYIGKFDPSVLIDREHDVIRVQTQVLPFFQRGEWIDASLWKKKKLNINAEITKELQKVISDMKKYHQSDKENDFYLERAVFAYEAASTLIFDLS